MIFAYRHLDSVAYVGALSDTCVCRESWLPYIARFCFTRCPVVSPSDFQGLTRGIENP